MTDAEPVYVVVQPRTETAIDEYGRAGARLFVQDTVVELVAPGDGHGEAFAFDRAFEPSASAADIHNAVVRPLLEAVSRGVNATVLIIGTGPPAIELHAALAALALRTLDGTVDVDATIVARFVGCVAAERAQVVDLLGPDEAPRLVRLMPGFNGVSAVAVPAATQLNLRQTDDETVRQAIARARDAQLRYGGPPASAAMLVDVDAGGADAPAAARAATMRASGLGRLGLTGAGGAQGGASGGGGLRALFTLAHVQMATVADPLALALTSALGSAGGASAAAALAAAAAADVSGARQLEVGLLIDEALGGDCSTAAVCLPSAAVGVDGGMAVLRTGVALRALVTLPMAGSRRLRRLLARGHGRALALREQVASLDARLRAEEAARGARRNIPADVAGAAERLSSIVDAMALEQASRESERDRLVGELVEWRTRWRETDRARQLLEGRAINADDGRLKAEAEAVGLKLELARSRALVEAARLDAESDALLAADALDATRARADAAEARLARALDQHDDDTVARGAAEEARREAEGAASAARAELAARTLDLDALSAELIAVAAEADELRTAAVAARADADALGKLRERADGAAAELRAERVASALLGGALRDAEVEAARAFVAADARSAGWQQRSLGDSSRAAQRLEGLQVERSELIERQQATSLALQRRLDAALADGALAVEAAGARAALLADEQAERRLLGAEVASLAAALAAATAAASAADASAAADEVAERGSREAAPSGGGLPADGSSPEPSISPRPRQPPRDHRAGARAVPELAAALAAAEAQAQRLLQRNAALCEAALDARRALLAADPAAFARLPLAEEVSRDADSGGGSGGGGGGARGFVSQLQHDSDARARDAAAQLDASRAALDDERARARRSHDALHAQLREAVDARDATAERLRGALAERAALAARLSAAEAEAASAQPAAALRDAHAALLDKLAALKGGGDWDFERARLDADALQLENARLRDELAAVVAFRAKQAERDAAVAGGGAGGAGDTRALASLRAQVTELRRLQYESERERSALKAQAAALEEELARTQAYMQGNMPRYEREIVGLRKQLETLAASAPPGSAGSRAPAPPSHSADESRDASEQNATRGSEATSLSSPASGGRRTPAARPDDGLNGGVR